MDAKYTNAKSGNENYSYRKFDSKIKTFVVVRQQVFLFIQKLDMFYQIKINGALMRPQKTFKNWGNIYWGVFGATNAATLEEKTTPPLCDGPVSC